MKTNKLISSKKRNLFKSTTLFNTVCGTLNRLKLLILSLILQKIKTRRTQNLLISPKSCAFEETLSIIFSLNATGH